MINQYMGVVRHLFSRVYIYIYVCLCSYVILFPVGPDSGFAIFSEAAVMDWESGFAQEVGTFRHWSC